MFEHGVVYRNEDSYCGPISMLAMLPDEELLVIFREARWRGSVTHADPTTRTSLLRSRDRGATWFSQVSPDPAGGNGTAMVRLSDGTLVANSFRWIFRPLEQKDEMARQYAGPIREWHGMACACGGVFMTRSFTDGYTWEPARRLAEPPDWPVLHCHGAAIELPDGELLLPVTVARQQDGRHLGAVLRSRDRGETWGELAVVTQPAPEGIPFHETRLVRCPSGRILAMHRTPDGNYWRNVSADAGRTWSATRETAIWCGGSSPPDLKLLRDGRLLLTRGYRREPFGVRAYLSEDEGENWDVEHPIVLRDDGPDRDVGYPTTLQFGDGSLITVYYWHGPDQLRHLQRTRWELP